MIFSNKSDFRIRCSVAEQQVDTYLILIVYRRTKVDLRVVYFGSLSGFHIYDFRFVVEPSSLFLHCFKTAHLYPFLS